jgi:ABC-2 type transport system ATP-binding protein
MTAARATAVVKRFESTVALDGVNLLVEEGEVRGLLGPNGAGKTTLLRILLGLVRPDSGSIELFGRPRRDAEPPGLAGVAGFVEDPSFYPYLSGRANLEVVAELDGGVSDARIDEVLERVDLAGRAGDRVSGYSTGMTQRLGIAASLLREPRLLLLDEPTAGLDPAGIRDMEALVRSLSEDGTAIVLSSHQIGEVEDACDTFTLIRRGQVVWDGTAERLRAEAPASAYGMSTSEDRRALDIASHQHGIHADAMAGDGIALTADQASLDRYVLALGEAGVAIRRLELLLSPLESMFFALTSDSEVDLAHPAQIAERALAEA